MKLYTRAVRLASAVILLLITAHRLPAPIQEVSESPTPTPTPALQVQSPPTPGTTPERANPSSFAGAWAGRIKIGTGGEVHVTLEVNSDATSLKQNSKRMGELTHPTTVNGRTLSWLAGKLNNVEWTLTPNPDGQTALAGTRLGGITSTAIFKRVQPSPAPPHK